MKSRDEKIEELLAKQEISELNARYCRGCDRCDEELLASVYHSDAIDNHGAFNGTAMAFAKWATDFHRTLISTSHFISNSLIEVDGNKAAGETYCHVWLRSRREDGNLEDVVFGGRYVDRFERRDGIWKFAVRSLLIDWHTILDAKEYEPGGGFSTSFVGGSRSHKDPSYDAVDQYGSWAIKHVIGLR